MYSFFLDNKQVVRGSQNKTLNSRLSIYMSYMSIKLRTFALGIGAIRMGFMPCTRATAAKSRSSHEGDSWRATFSTDLYRLQRLLLVPLLFYVVFSFMDFLPFCFHGALPRLNSGILLLHCSIFEAIHRGRCRVVDLGTTKHQKAVHDIGWWLEIPRKTQNLIWKSAVLTRENKNRFTKWKQVRICCQNLLFTANVKQWQHPPYLFCPRQSSQVEHCFKCSWCEMKIYEMKVVL